MKAYFKNIQSLLIVVLAAVLLFQRNCSGPVEPTERIIHDTIIDVMAFASASKSMDWPDKEAFEEYARRLINEYDYIFYVSPEGVDIEDNGIRETDADYRNEIDIRIQTILSQNKHRIKRYGELKGSTEDRIYQLVNYIDL